MFVGQVEVHALELVEPSGLSGAEAGQGSHTEGVVLLANVPAGQVVLQRVALEVLKSTGEGHGEQTAALPPGLKVPAAHPRHPTVELKNALPGGQGLHCWAPGAGETRP